ncbi:hypothetical protein BJ878DRAFT_489711 [Calycina marina]|uniref:F-box domain-containing protein n=1 Tax=Calycina marina TaxID=1763456 RepID=A0A9P8CIB9_9HELO|nr:hypothetical protein BJ878DRAFT_489711 [Calycina marina]
MLPTPLLHSTPSTCAVFWKNRKKESVLETALLRGSVCGKKLHIDRFHIDNHARNSFAFACFTWCSVNQRRSHLSDPGLRYHLSIMMNGPGTWSAFATLMRTIGEPNSELEYFLAEAPPELGDHVLEYLDQPDINALSHASLVIRFSPPLRFYRRKERLEARIRAREQERGQESTMGPSSKLFRRRCGLSRADYNAAFTSTEVSDDKNRPPTATTSVNRAKHDDDPGASDDETYVPALHITPAVRQRILSTVCPEYNRQGIVIPEAPDLDRVPTEVLLMVYGRLDNIDACCLGLSSPHQYRIYRALFGTKIKLNTRRDGQAGTIEKSWEVVGKNQCPHCDPFRCQLYRHLEVWMGPKFEYCSSKDNFGIPAPPGAPAQCYRSKPSKPRRCGRHPIRTTTMHQDDISFSSNYPTLLVPLMPQ